MDWHERWNMLRKLYIISFVCLSAVLIFFQLFPVPHPFQTFDTGSPIRTLVFTPAAQIVIGTEQNVQVWSSQTYQRQRTLIDASGPALYIPQSRRILAVHRASGSDEPHDIGVWNSDTGLMVMRFVGHRAAITSLATNADGSLLLSASQDGTVRLWRTVDGSTLHVWDRSARPIGAIALSPDGGLLAIGGSDSTIELWSTSDWTLQRTIPTTLEAIQTVAFRPNGRVLAAGGIYGDIGLWVVSDGRPITMLVQHTDRVNVITYSADEQYIVSGSGSTHGPKAGVDSSVRVWRASDGELFQTYRGSLDMISRRRRIMTAVAISPESKVVAGGDAGGTVRLWRVP